MKKLSVLLLCSCVLVQILAARVSADAFTADAGTPAAAAAQTGTASPVRIPQAAMSAWARSGVEAAYNDGLVSPDFALGGNYTRKITRLEFARLTVEYCAAETSKTVEELAQTAGVTLVPDGQGYRLGGPGSFSDTDSVYAELAAKLGIVRGADGSFRPDDPIRRAEAAAMLRRCMAALGVADANAQPMTFSDIWQLPRWAVEDVKFVSGRTDAAGTVLMGGSGGAFAPLGSFTIEQAILTVGRMHATKTLTAVCAGWKDAPGYDTVTLALTFGGDCTLGRDRGAAYAGSLDEMYDRKGAAYFFSGVTDFKNDDLSMVNFEGTLTTADTPAQKTFRFKGRPEYADILTAGSIDVVTVANNHSMDYLQQGYNDTLSCLSPVVAVSGYDNLPIVNVKGVNIGFASNTGWSFDGAQKSFISNAVKNLRARGADIVVFNYHWGVEKSYRSNATQQAIAHYCIDAGADLVIGNHPHVTQETETYRGRQIAYSLGNLVFGGNTNPADKNCLLFRQNFTLELDSGKIVGETHAALPYSVSSVSWRNDYHPVPRS